MPAGRGQLLLSHSIAIVAHTLCSHSLEHSKWTIKLRTIEQRTSDFSRMGHRVNIVVFVGCLVSCSHSVLLLFCEKRARQNQTNGHGWTQSRTSPTKTDSNPGCSSLTPCHTILLLLKKKKKASNTLLSYHVCVFLFILHTCQNFFNIPCFFVNINYCLD